MAVKLVRICQWRLRFPSIFSKKSTMFRARVRTAIRIPVYNNKVSTEDNVLDKFRFALIPDEQVVFPEEIVHEILYP